VLLVAVLLAVALSPIVDRLERWGLSRKWAVAALATCAALLLGAFVTLVAPPLAAQVTVLLKVLPGLRGLIAGEIERYGALSPELLPLLDLPASPAIADWLPGPLRWGRTLVEAAAAALLVVVLSFYLLLDGRAVVAWLLAYVPRRHRGRMSATVPEVFDVVKAFVTGQLTATGLFSLFCFVVLSVYRVPAALPLALFSGACSAVPSVGILAAMAAAGLIGLTVSPGTSLAVLGLYFVYHQFEAYVLMPRLYGGRLRLSTLTVILAIVAGGMLDGIVGAILALPIVAAYPVIEKHWLGEYLHPDAVEDHASLDAASSERTEGHDAAVEAVLRGEKPAPPE
jgi:predicted PurR-regulated permease PerM